MESISALAGDDEEAARFARLPEGWGTVRTSGEGRFDGYLRVTENLVICYLRKPDIDGRTCRIWPWARVIGVDLVEDE